MSRLYNILNTMLTIIKALPVNMPDVRTGTVAASTIGNISAGSYKDITITYAEMKNVPMVIPIRTAAGSVGYNLEFAMNTVTKTSCGIRIWNMGTSAVGPVINWVAIAPGGGS